MTKEETSAAMASPLVFAATGAGASPWYWGELMVVKPFNASLWVPPARTIRIGSQKVPSRRQERTTLVNISFRASTRSQRPDLRIVFFRAVRQP